MVAPYWLLSSSSLSVAFVSMMLSLGDKNGGSGSSNHNTLLAAAGGASSAITVSCRGDTSQRIVITGLYRYAVKGLSADALSHVTFTEPGQTFPDDRRYALLYDDKKTYYKPGEWLHKENFLCAFTAPELLAQLESSYRRIIINVPSSSSENADDGDDGNNNNEPRGLLTIRERSTGIELLPETNLATVQGRLELGDFLTKLCGQKVTCVTGDDNETTTPPRTNSSRNKQESSFFQFGNTSSGVKNNKGNSRTIHMVNENTIKEVSKKLGISLNPTRFRPNVIFRGPPAWSEFDWIDKCLQVVVDDDDDDDSGGHGHDGDLDNGDRDASSSSSSYHHQNHRLQIRIICRTVRCQGVSVDPLTMLNNNNNDEQVDIPGLLAKHFPQHGPYLGVYAVIESPGTLFVNQELSIC